MDAAADGLNEEAVPDAFRHGVWPSRNPGCGNDLAYLLVHGFFALRPKPFRGLRPGLNTADTMNLVEQLDKGIGDGNSPPDMGQMRQQAKNEARTRVICRSEEGFLISFTFR